MLILYLIPFMAAAAIIFEDLNDQAAPRRKTSQRDYALAKESVMRRKSPRR